MRFRLRKTFKILAPGNSLRRRVAYSLAIARLILVPVIFLAVYYLFEMGWIVDRIVNTDAPAATHAQEASIQLLESRRAERNYLLLRDARYLAAYHQAVENTEEILGEIQDLEPQDAGDTSKALAALQLYEQRFNAAVAVAGPAGQLDADRIRAVVHAYEQDLDNLLRARSKSRAQLVEQLRTRVEYFDTQISETAQQTNPDLARLTGDLQSTSEVVLQVLAALQSENWKRVEADHREARLLLIHAEWALSIVSVLTLIFSIWVSFVLPRQVTKPLVSLREAVDHAAEGRGPIDFEIQGKGEVAELAISVRRLIARVQQTSETGAA
jgi:CHASE3 domain sensor protein